jgi:hypothetical protein
MRWKPTRLLLNILLAVLAFVLISFYTIRWKFGQFLPDVIDKNFFSVVVLAVLGVSLWNRRIWMEEKKKQIELSAAHDGTEVQQSGENGEKKVEEDYNTSIKSD